MSNLTSVKRTGGELATAPNDQREAVRQALKTSLYPGARDESIDMVLAYCRAAGLDPMQKPVHIVPMWDAGKGRLRDVIMPGIGLYRTNAARTGEFAGMSEPEFGPAITQRLGSRDFTFPEWCKVTVYRQLRTGHVAQFTAVEYWIENYAIKGGPSQDQSPNAMWTKRPRGQIAKCAQAQALRMAFPEATGAGPTADEMEGGVIDVDVVQVSPQGAPAAPAQPEPVELPPYSDEDFQHHFPAWTERIKSGSKTADEIITQVSTRYTLTEKQRQAIKAIRTASPQADGATEHESTEQEEAE